jgi:PII-like signaling protein
MNGKGKLLKIYIGESDHHHGEPLYHEIIKIVKASGLAGATTIRGIEGFGANSVIHSTRILRLSEDLPILIEVVDTEEKIRALVNVLDAKIKTGVLMALQDVEIVKYARDAAAHPQNNES